MIDFPKVNPSVLFSGNDGGDSLAALSSVLPHRLVSFFRLAQPVLQPFRVDHGMSWVELPLLTIVP